MSIFDFLFGSEDKDGLFFSKKQINNAKEIVSQQEGLHHDTREFASTYKSIEKRMLEYQVSSKLADNSGTTSGGTSTIGSTNSKLYGVSDYNGPDSTTTKNPWNSFNGPFTSGIKSKLETCAQFDDIILKHCEANQMDPMMVKIIVLMESSGNPNCVSQDGYNSKGLTQITVGNVGVDNIDGTKLLEPDYNIEMFMVCAEGKAAVARSLPIPTSVKNIAHLWNGYSTNGKYYRDAFAEIYAGFGLDPNNDYKTIQGVKEGSGGASSTGTGGRLREDSAKFIKKLKSYLGVPYVWGGTTPSGFDCSGLIQYCVRELYGDSVASAMGRVTTSQEKSGKIISVEDAVAGDLFFWGSKGNTRHVAVCLGDGTFIHAPKPGDVVKIIPISSYTPDFAVIMQK